MKRSQINRKIKDAMTFTKEFQFKLPAFAYWTPENWKTKGNEISEIIKNALGWDITDFESGNFQKSGLILFTLRNGLFGDKSPHAKSYCEKIMVVQEEQITPFHHHRSKVEDIINRGGGILQIEVYKSTKDDQKSNENFEISVDGCKRIARPGEIIELHPGDSVTLTQQHYHKFWGKKGNGSILVGEVSAVNNDYVDNVFYGGISRFSTIEEDEPPFYLLSGDYKNYISKN